MCDTLKALTYDINVKVSNLSKEFEECTKIIEDITSAASSCQSTPRQFSERSSRRSDRYRRFGLRNQNEHGSPPSMYKYYNPPTVTFRNSYELRRSLSPPEKRFSPARNTPERMFIQNSYNALENTNAIECADDCQRGNKWQAQARNMPELSRLQSGCCDTIKGKSR
jgi:hypothetical protein